MILLFTVFDPDRKPMPNDLAIDADCISAIVLDVAGRRDGTGRSYHVAVAIVRTRDGFKYPIWDLERDAVARWSAACGERLEEDGNAPVP